MSPKRPGGERGESDNPDNIDFVLEQIKLDTRRAELMPTPAQFKYLTEKVKNLELATHIRDSAWKTYCGDLERLLSFLPTQGGVRPRQLYTAIKQERFYNHRLWQKFYDDMLDFFHDQAAKDYPALEEKEFWEACFGKYLEMCIKYKDIM